MKYNASVIKVFAKYFILTFIVLAIFVSIYEHKNIESEKTKALIEGHNTFSRIERLIDTYINKTYFVETFLQTYNDKELQEIASASKADFKKHFDLIAQGLRLTDDVQVLQISPNGFNVYAYPSNKNKVSYNINVFKEPLTQDEAIRARDSGSVVVSGPRKLRQQNLGLVIRNPIFYHDNTFWGFVTCILKVPEILNSWSLNSLELLGYEYELFWEDKFGIRHSMTSTFPNKQEFDGYTGPVELSRQIYKKKWILYIKPAQGWVNTLFIVYEILFCIVLAALFAYIETKKYLISQDLENIAKKEKDMRITTSKALTTARQANAAKSRFLSSLSHDIRTPMNSIIGLSILTQRDYTNPQKVLEHSYKITHVSDHILCLINDILDISKIESGKLTLNNNEFLLADFIKHIHTLIYPQACDKEIEFKIYAQHIKHDLIFADKLRLSQIILNILSNSVKYTHNGGKIQFFLKEIDNVDKDKVKFSFVIKDNGMGISPEYLEHIFEPFIRDNVTRVEGIQGTGLGMTITKNLVDLMQGSINIQSQISQGTQTTLEFVFKATDLSNDNQAFFESHKVQNVFLIDDAIDAKNANFSLNNACINCTCATNKDTVYEILSTIEKSPNFYNLIIIDPSIIQDCIYDVLDKIRNVNQNIPIILLTHVDLTFYSEICIKYDIKEKIARPFFISSLMTALIKLDKNISSNINTTCSLNGLNILAAEDNKLNREILIELLEMKGAKCTACADGQEAVDKFIADNGQYDLILMDVLMPKLNGYEATKKIRESGIANAKSINIIAMTGNAFSSDIKASIEAGMNYHLSKPINMKELEDVVTSLITNKLLTSHS